MKSALVIGGAGFLGARVAKACECEQIHTLKIDPAFQHSIVTGPKPSFEMWSCRFEEIVARLNSVDYVFHCAASLTKSNVDERNRKGVDAFQDIALDLCVAEYLEKHPPRERAVWLSSSAVDAQDYEAYAFVKYVGERFAVNLAKHGVPVSILRPFGGYGPGQSLEYPMPAIMSRAIRHEDPLVVWGGLDTVRDWIYVDDLVRAIMMAAALPEWPSGVPVDIGTGFGLNFWNLAKCCADLAGYNPQIVADNTKPVASRRRVANTELAEKLGFKATVRLGEGMKKVWDSLTPKESSLTASR